MFVMLEQSFLLTSLGHTHLYPRRGGHTTAQDGDSMHALLSPDSPVYLMAVPIQMCGFICTVVFLILMVVSVAEFSWAECSALRFGDFNFTG